MHAVALESSCYRLTSDEKCMYKCTKIIVCCSRDPANYRKIVTHIYHNGEKRKRMQKKENDDACFEQDQNDFDPYDFRSTYTYAQKMLYKNFQSLSNTYNIKFLTCIGKFKKN